MSSSFKKTLSMILVVCMCLSIIPAAAFAEAPEGYAWAEYTSPTCTEDGYVTYYNEEGEEIGWDTIPCEGHSFQDGWCTVCGEPDPDWVDLSEVQEFFAGEEQTVVEEAPELVTEEVIEEVPETIPDEIVEVVEEVADEVSSDETDNAEDADKPEDEPQTENAPQAETETAAVELETAETFNTGEVVASVTKLGEEPVTYTDLHAALDAARVAAGGGWNTTSVTVEILADITFESGDTWTPVTFSQLNPITINGNNRTITGLPGMLYAKSGSGVNTLTINDLTFASCTAYTDQTSNGYALILGYIDSGYGATFNNVSIINSSITGGKWTGAFVGYAAGYNNNNDGAVFQNIVLNNCKVENCEISGAGSAGALIGHAAGNPWTHVEISGTEVKHNTITGEKAAKTGILIGTGGAAQPDQGKNGGIWINAIESGNTLGTGGQYEIGRLGSEGCTITFTKGGSYTRDPLLTSDHPDRSTIAAEAGYVVKQLSDGTWTIGLPDPVARIGDTQYSSLEEAVSKVEDNETITLLTNITLGGKLVINNGKEFTLDLGGYTLTGRVNIYNAKVTIQNGTVDAGNGNQALNVYGTDDPSYAGSDYTVLNVESDVTVTGNYGICFLSNPSNAYYPICYGVTVNMYGTSTAGSPMYVSGNIGFDNYVANIGNSYPITDKLVSGCNSPSKAMSLYGPVFNVYGNLIADSDLASENSQGISLSGMVTVNVYDGARISGSEGVGMKSGILNVYGGTITGTGAFADPIQAVNSGTEASGGAISASSYYQNNIFADAAGMKINISGGTITGTNNSAIRVGHSYSNGIPVAMVQGVQVNVTGGNFSSGYDNCVFMEPAVTGDTNYSFTITGGTYSSDPTVYVADGYEAVKIDEDHWKVGKLTQTVPTQSTENPNQYSVDRTVVENKQGGATITQQHVVVTVISEPAGEGNIVATEANQINTDTVVNKALAEGADQLNTGDNTVTVGLIIQSEKQTGESSPSVVYKVNPYAIITVNGDENSAKTIELENSDLKAGSTFSFELPVNLPDGTPVTIVHKSDDTNVSDETFGAIVKNGKVPITVSHFSTFTIDQITPTAGMVAVNLDSRTQYATLTGAIDAADAGNTIALLKDITEGEGDIAVQKNVTLDLNGKTLTIDPNTDAAFLINKKNVEFTVTDSGTGGAISSDADGLIGIYATSTNTKVTMSGGKIELTGAGSEGIESTKGSIIITGGFIKAEKGIYNPAGCNATITGGTIIGTVYPIQNVDGGEVYISGDAIVSGTLYSTYPNLLVITGGLFTDDTTNYAPLNYGDPADNYISWASGDNTYPWTVLPAVTVTFDAGEGATVDGTNQTAVFSVAKGKSFASAPENKGYAVPTASKTNSVFDGWTDFDKDAAINADAIYTAAWIPATASLTHDGVTTNYANMMEAYADAVDGDTITLLADDYSLAEGAELEIDKSITIDGGGHTIYGMATNNGYNDIFINAATDKTVVIKNVTVRQFGSQKSTASGHAPIWVSTNNRANVLIDSVTVQEFNRTGIFLGGGNCTVSNCYIDCSKSTDYGDVMTKGVETHHGVVATIMDTTIVGATNTYDRWTTSGIEIYGTGDIAIDNCTITSLTSGIAISDVVAAQGGDLGTSHVTVTNCNVTATGYALDTSSDSAVMEVESGNFVGAVYSRNGNDNGIQISGGTFDAEVPAEYCADGYVPVTEYDANNNPYYTVDPAYNIKFMMDDGTTLISSVNISKTEEARALLADEIPSDTPEKLKDGYTLAGWKWGSAAFDTQTIIERDYVLTAQFTQDSNVTWTITGADANSNVVYTGNPVNVSAAVEPNNGAQNIEFKVRDADDSTYSATAPSNVGEYTARVTVAGTDAWTAVSATKDFQIVIATITPTVTLADYVAGNTPSAPAVTGNAGNGAVTYQYKAKDAADDTYAAFNIVDGNYPTTAGEYTLKAYVAATENYGTATAETTFTVSAAVASITKGNPEVTTYYATLASAVSGAAAGDTVTLLEDIALITTQTISRNLTLDLNGHNITVTGNTGLRIRSTVTITGPGTISSNKYRAIEVNSRNANVTIGENVTVTCSDSEGYGVFLTTGAPQLTTYGTISGGKAGIIQSMGTTTIKGGNVSGGQYGVSLSAGSVVVDDGTVTGTEAGLYLQAGSATINGGNVTAEGSTHCAVAIYKSAKLTVNGGTLSGTDHAYAIASNGNTTGSNYTVNITGGTVSSDDVAIYHCNIGTVNVAGGTITGKTAIYQKSGTLNITDGTINGTGDAGHYGFNGNGANATGNAIVVDNCGYPGGDPTVSISGGTFNSANAEAVHSYIKTDDTTQTGTFTRVENFVSGGVFSSEVPDNYAAEGMIPAVLDPAMGTYTVVAGATITFVNYDDTVLETKNVEKDGEVTYTKATPTKPADASGVYTFDGWTVSGSTEVITELPAATTTDVTYTAHYSSVTSVASITKSGTTTFYATLKDAIDAANLDDDADTITILANFTTDASKTAEADRTVISEPVTIDFGAYTMYVPGSLEPTANWAALFIDNNTTVKATTGGIDCLDKDNDEVGVYAFNVRNNAKLTIESGSYHGGGTIAQAQLGTVEILGGIFTATAFSDPYGMNFVFNCVDSAYAEHTASFDIKGGTFVGFDPQNNAAEGANTDFTGAGFVAIKDNDGNYVVQQGANITFQNGDEVLETKRVAKDGAVAYTGATPTKTADAAGVYTFDGWAETADGNKLDSLPAATTTDVTYYAHYSSVTSVASITKGTPAETTYHPTLADAVTAAEANDTVTLLADIALTATQVIDKNLTIDLNGKNIAATDARALWVKSGEVAITGTGTISAGGNIDPSSSVIRVGDGAANNAKAKLTVGANVTVSSDVCYGVTVFGYNDTDNEKTTSDIELVVNGTVAVTGTAAAISGNGTNSLSATTMTINGTVTAAQDYAIYHPGKGTLTVNGAVSGLGGIEVKSGTVTINNGASVTATATTQSHSVNNNGASSSGYAIAAINNAGYVGDPTVTISGGTITGKTVILADGDKLNGATVTKTGGTADAEEGYVWSDDGKLRKSITVTAEAKTKTYGDVDPEFTAAVSPAIETGDEITYTLSRAAGEDVGTYAITPSGDANQGNYAVTYAPANLTISKKAATVTANDKSKTYGATDPELTATVTGLVGSDTLNYTLARAEGVNVGTYTITVTLGENSNYDVTATDGTFTINKRALTIKAADASKVLGNVDPEFNYEIISGSLAADEAITYSYSKTPAEDVVGNSTINPTAIIEKSGVNVTENYEITAQAGTLTISAAVAKIGETYYASLRDAVAAAGVDNGAYITILDEVALTESVVIAKDLTIDLNGHNITAENSRALWIKSGDVTITGTGTIQAGTATSSFGTGSSVIRVGDGSKATDVVDKTAALTIGENVTVTSPYCYGVTVFGTNGGADAVGQTLNVYGEISVTGTASAIGGNGNPWNAKTEINVYDGAVISAAGDTGIYHPQAGTLIIDGGMISGPTAIETKSGNTNVTISGNPTISATGMPYHSANGNGPSTSGYAIAAVENSGYKGGANVAIGSGVFTGPIAILKDTDVGTDSEAKIEVSGGYFTETVDPAYMAVNKLCTITLNEYGMYYVVDAIDVEVDPNGGSFGEPVLDAKGNAYTYGVNEDIRTYHVPKGETFTIGTANVTNGTRTLAGWKLTFSGMTIDTQDPTFSQTITAKTSLKAIWSDKVTVSFDLNDKADGSRHIVTAEEIEANRDLAPFAPQVMEKGERAYYPDENPTRTGYSFNGWLYEKENNEWVPFKFSTQINESLTLKAGWKAEKYNVIFTDDDGTILSVVSYDYGTAAADINRPADPTKAPDEQFTYTFKAWDPEIADVTGEATYKATYEATQNVAKIGDTYYTDLQAAIEAADDNDTIVLLVDLTVEGNEDGDALIAESGKSFTLDLNGKMLTLTGDLYITNDTSVTVANGTIFGDTMENGWCLVFLETGELIVDDGATLDAGENYGISVWNDGTSAGGANVEVKPGAKITANGDENSAIGMTSHASRSTLTISGGAIEAGNAAAVYAEDLETVEITGGTIKNNSARYGTIHTMKAGTNISVSGNVTVNNASGNSLTLFSGSVEISGGRFNQTLYADYETNKPTISGGVFENAPDESFIADGYIVTANDGDDKDAYPYKVVEAVTVTFDAGAGNTIDGTNQTIEVKIPVGGTVPATSVPDTALNGNKLFTFKEWQRNGVKYDPETAEPFTKAETITAAWTKLATVSASLSLRDRIDLNFVVRDVSGDPDDYAAWYEIDGELTKVPLTEKWEEANNRYFFPIAKCAAKEMADTFTFKLTYKNEGDVLDPNCVIFDNADSINSVMAYCNSVLDNQDASVSLRNLCLAVVNYGGIAQQYFDYNTDHLANSKYNDEAYVQTIEVPEYKSSHSGSIDFFSKFNVSLDLVSQTGLRFIITVNKGKSLTAENVTVSKGLQDYEHVTFAKSGRQYLITADEINAQELNEVFTVTITCGDDTFSYQYSPLTFAYKNQTSESNGLLCKALYNYYLMAHNYNA